MRFVTYRENGEAVPQTAIVVEDHLTHAHLHVFACNENGSVCKHNVPNASKGNTVDFSQPYFEEVAQKEVSNGIGEPLLGVDANGLHKIEE